MQKVESPWQGNENKEWPKDGILKVLQNYNVSAQESSSDNTANWNNVVSLNDRIEQTI